MSKKVIYYSLFLLILISCSEKSGRELFPEYYKSYSKLNKMDKYKKYTHFSIYLGIKEIDRRIKKDNKYVFISRLRDGSKNDNSLLAQDSGIFTLDEKFNLVLKKRIKVGRGPGEYISINFIHFFNNKYYIFDSGLSRFLVYDKNFNYLDTINFNRDNPINDFIRVEDGIWGYSCKDNIISFYEAEFSTTGVKFDFIKKIELGNLKFKSLEEKRSKYFSRTVYNFKNKIGITLSNNLVFFKKKGEKIEKLREVYLGKSRKTTYNGKSGIYTTPGIKALDDNLNVLFTFPDHKIYNYKKNKIYETGTPNFVLVFDFDNRKYYYLGTKGYYYKEK